MSNSLKETLLKINDSVYPVIKQLLSQNVEETSVEAALYQCKVGGKRIRPALLVLSGQVFGADINSLLHPAASIEILHNSTLIIDDIIDHSEFRRDEPTCWNKFGKSIAECMAFTYLSSVFAGLSHANNGSKLVDLYSKTLKIIIDGEIKDILFERLGREDEPFVVKNRYKTISKKDYFKMISQKTAILLRSSCQAGAICADATPEQATLIGDFGFNLGLAFQIRDDMLDIFGDEKEFGKKIGKDIIEKKMGNYVTLSALERLKPQDAKIITDLLNNPAEITDENIQTVKALIEKTDAKKHAEDTANNFIDNAIQALDKLPKNEYNDTLRELARYVVDREK